MGRQDQYSVTFICDGRAFGVYDSLSGGAVTAEETKHRPGGMGRQESYGGPASTENVTFSRVFKRGRDTELLHFLMSRVGKGRCTVNRQPLDSDGNAFGDPLVYTGILNGVTPGEVDSNSSDPDMYELEVSTDGVA
jgi:hypothetical protein